MTKCWWPLKSRRVAMFHINLAAALSPKQSFCKELLLQFLRRMMSGRMVIEIETKWEDGTRELAGEGNHRANYIQARYPSTTRSGLQLVKDAKDCMMIESKNQKEKMVHEWLHDGSDRIGTERTHLFLASACFLLFAQWTPQEILSKCPSFITTPGSSSFRHV